MAPTTGNANQIFISYRREDSGDITGRIYDRLVQKFGSEAIFKDVDSIPPGVNFKHYLDSVVKQCQVLLVVMGDEWMGKVGEKRKIDDARDYMRIEIESALQRNIPVIPLLVQDNNPPTEEELPQSLKELAYRHAVTIGYDPHFHSDVDRLIKSLESVFGPPQPHLPSEPAVNLTPSPSKSGLDPVRDYILAALIAAGVFVMIRLVFPFATFIALAAAVILAFIVGLLIVKRIRQSR